LPAEAAGKHRVELVRTLKFLSRLY
jgi:hypothetical protein